MATRRGKTYREGRVRINLILGGDAEAGVAVSSGPRQVHSRLQLVVDLLVDGAAKLGAVVAEGKTRHFQSERYRNVHLSLRLSWVHQGQALTPVYPLQLWTPH